MTFILILGHPETRVSHIHTPNKASEAKEAAVEYTYRKRRKVHQNNKMQKKEERKPVLNRGHESVEKDVEV